MTSDKVIQEDKFDDQAALFQEMILSVGTVLDLDTLLGQLAARVVESLPCDRCLVLTLDDENLALRFGALRTMPQVSAETTQFENFDFALYSAEAHAVIDAWMAGQAQHLTPETVTTHRALNWLMSALQTQQMYSVPLTGNNQLIGVLLVDNPHSTQPLTPELESRLKTLASAGAVTMQNARIYSKTVHQAETHLRELTILRQIDRELNDTIEPQHVFQMTLDWALRFTNAHAASVALYDQDTDELRVMVTYGYDIEQEQLAILRMEQGGIAHRVARSAHAEVIPDTMMDKDFIQGTSLTRSQMSVPVMREDRVIAVITVESKKLNGFADEQLDFVEKLATRAGVAIDNARLFDETAREREKLSHILNNIADVVIVFGLDERLILINPAAVSALRIYPHEVYQGQKFQDVVMNTAVIDAYMRARTSGDPIVEEVQMNNDRTFHMNLIRQENVGWIIVMHDITPFKEMDQLKSELIATVSHDLKQPLAVMNGYIELLLMHRQFDTTGINFLDMVRRSIQNMRQLIDDLLDLAKIETGIHLNLQSLELKDLVEECRDALQPSVLNKALELAIDIPPDLPPLLADRARLHQILMNLIGNAVKYTQPEGWVRVMAESRDKIIRIAIQDNGMGISPEDQAHIFERFYRVRRPETDSIDGTGLGLAIVKSLVEAHKGKISLESRLGEGTTFFLTLPVASQSEEKAPASPVEK